MWKQAPSFLCTQETHLNIKDRLTLQGQKKIFQANGHKNQASVVNLVSDRIDFKPKLI